MTILYGMFLGNGGSASLALDNHVCLVEETDPDDALASLVLRTSGAFEYSDGTTGSWLSSGTASNYEVRATVTSGSFSTGATGSWVALSSERTWTVSRTTSGSKSCIATFEIGLAGQSTAIVTATIELRAAVLG